MNQLNLTQEFLTLKEQISKIYKGQVKKEFVDSSDMKKLFNITDCTLQRLRDKNEIPCAKLGGKYYYPIDMITAILMERLQPKFKK